MKSIHVGSLSGRLLILLLALSACPLGADETFPPGWLPLSSLDDKPSWSDVRDIRDRIHLYLPGSDQPVRGVFACFVFHSGDPRELADLWNFALVTVPWPFEYDLGVNDKRNGRYKLGHESQNMGLLLRYLEAAGKESKHPELATVPIVGWLGQNGSRLCADLYERAPGRVLAWSDSFPNALRKFPKLTANVPYPFAWEANKADLKSGQRTYRKDPDPPVDLSCRASTYGFGHGIYSKFNFFMFYLDRCIKVRMPSQMPAPGMPVTIKEVTRDTGWVGDFDPIGSWNPISVAGEEENATRYPVWFPDEYTAWAWRSYHSSCNDLKITGPRHTYSKIGGKWGGNGACGLGYGGFLSANETHTFSASVKGDYTKIEFHDGNRVVGGASAPTWTVEGVKLQPGLRVLFAVGIRGDGSRAASRPALAIVK